MVTSEQTRTARVYIFESGCLTAKLVNNEQNCHVALISSEHRCALPAGSRERYITCKYCTQSYMTCSIWLASKTVPGGSTMGEVTCPASTHTMLGNSSSPKSGISFAFSSHGFHTTGGDVALLVNRHKYYHEATHPVIRSTSYLY